MTRKLFSEKDVKAYCKKEYIYILKIPNYMDMTNVTVHCTVSGACLKFT